METPNAGCALTTQSGPATRFRPSHLIHGHLRNLPAPTWTRNRKKRTHPSWPKRLIPPTGRMSESARSPPIHHDSRWYKSERAESATSQHVFASVRFRPQLIAFSHNKLIIAPKSADRDSREQKCHHKLNCAEIE